MDIVEKKIISIGGGGFTHQTDKFLDECHKILPSPPSVSTAWIESNSQFVPGNTATPTVAVINFLLLDPCFQL